MDEPARIEYDDFVRCRGNPFTVIAGEVSFDLTLTEVSARTVSGELESFSLVFEGPVDPPLTQGIVQLSKTSLGVFQIFLVVVAKRDNHSYYEAVFNRYVVENPR